MSMKRACDIFFFCTNKCIYYTDRYFCTKKVRNCEEKKIVNMRAGQSAVYRILMLSGWWRDVDGMLFGKLVLDAQLLGCVNWMLFYIWVVCVGTSTTTTTTVLLLMTLLINLLAASGADSSLRYRTRWSSSFCISI